MIGKKVLISMLITSYMYAYNNDNKENKLDRYLFDNNKGVIYGSMNIKTQKTIVDKSSLYILNGYNLGIDYKYNNNIYFNTELKLNKVLKDRKDMTRISGSEDADNKRISKLNISYAKNNLNLIIGRTSLLLNNGYIFSDKKDTQMGQSFDGVIASYKHNEHIFTGGFLNGYNSPSNQDKIDSEELKAYLLNYKYKILSKTYFSFYTYDIKDKYNINGLDLIATADYDEKTTVFNMSYSTQTKPKNGKTNKEFINNSFTNIGLKTIFDNDLSTYIGYSIIGKDYSFDFGDYNTNISKRVLDVIDNDGLVDLSLNLTYKKINFLYNKFSSENKKLKYGKEKGIRYNQDLNKNIKLNLEYAKFDGLLNMASGSILKTELKYIF